MASFAKLNNENVVIQVVAVNNDVIKDSNGIEQESLGIDFLKNIYNEPNSIWKQTSYNTFANKYYNPSSIDGKRIVGDQSKAFRKNFAGLGYKYDLERDAFISPKPYNSWILNEDTCCWESPVPKPSELNKDGSPPQWNEELLQWVYKDT